jgi:hypothetical protein
MAHATEADLQGWLPLLRQLRDIKGLREVRPGIFHNRSVAFLHFHIDAGALVVDLKKPGGGGFDRYRVDTPANQRKLVDDARRRAGRNDDD